MLNPDLEQRRLLIFQYVYQASVELDNAMRIRPRIETFYSPLETSDAERQDLDSFFAKVENLRDRALAIIGAEDLDTFRNDPALNTKRQPSSEADSSDLHYDAMVDLFKAQKCLINCTGPWSVLDFHLRNDPEGDEQSAELRAATTKSYQDGQKIKAEILSMIPLPIFEHIAINLPRPTSP